MSFLRSLLIVCGCPATAAIPTITLPACIERFGQIQKLILQRTYNGTVLNEIVTATTDPTLQLTWTDLKAAVDSTKIQQTPYIQAPENTAGEPRKYGGGNATLGGTELILGAGPSPFTAEFLDMPQTTAKYLKQFRCETGLSVFPVNAKGQIGAIADDNESITKVRGIPVESFFVGDKIFGNFDNPDKNAIEFSFQPDWSDEFTVITPVFNPLLVL